MKIARQFGVTLNEFLNMSEPDAPRFDDTERNLFRALYAWESDLCTGCGQPQSKSLYDSQQENHSYGAGFVTCIGCEELLKQQEVQRLKDSKAQYKMAEPYKKKPHLAPQLVTGHRHWRAWELGEK